MAHLRTYLVTLLTGMRTDGGVVHDLSDPTYLPVDPSTPKPGRGSPPLVVDGKRIADQADKLGIDKEVHQQVKMVQLELPPISPITITSARSRISPRDTPSPTPPKLPSPTSPRPRPRLRRIPDNNDLSAPAPLGADDIVHGASVSAPPLRTYRIAPLSQQQANLQSEPKWEGL